MSNSDCATIIKRGYLFDKKAGLLDGKKKWFVLRQDSVMGYCILEHFKDEKSWSRREPSKGFINVQEIVEVIRIQDKKQTLELLCPGVGYRLMAYSEADADDWVEAIKKLIVYRKDVRSMSFPRMMSSQSKNGSSPLSSSPPSLPLTTNSINGPLFHHSALSVPPPHPSFSIDGSNFPRQSPQHQQQQQHQFPTPPETIVDTSNPLTTPILQKQSSHDGMNPYPSPPSSNDSASMCGSSTNSFDSGSINDGSDIMDSFHKIHSKFRVSVNDSEKLNAIGECDLIISEDVMILTNPITGSQIASWPLGAIRRYGINSVCFTFESGRSCSIGEGQFYFYSPQSRLIYKQVHSAILKMNKEPRRSSTPADLLALRTGSSMIIPITRVPSSNDSLSSPPQYNHIEHQLRQQPLSHELYTKLQQNSPSAISACSSFSAFTTDYEKLTHNSPGIHSSAPVLPIRSPQQPIAQSQSYPEPLYSTLKEMDTEDQEVIEDDDITPCNDVPPPIPPRSSKTTPI